MQMDATMSIEFDLITAREVAGRTGLSCWTVYRWARIGLLPSIKLGRRRLFDRRDLESFIDDHRQCGQITHIRGALASLGEGGPE